MFGGNGTMHVGVTRESVTFFVGGFHDLVELLQKTDSVGICRPILMRFAAFFPGRKALFKGWNRFENRR